LDIDVEKLVNNFSAEEAEKLPRIAICVVENKESDLDEEKTTSEEIFLACFNSGRKESTIRNQAFNTACQAAFTGIATATLSKWLKEKMEKDDFPRDKALEKIGLHWDSNEPIWGGFPIFEKKELVGGVAVVGVPEEDREKIEKLIEEFF